MIEITINSRKYEVEEGITIMQACHNNGIEIPHFCYHEKLKIAGNCRMCLVEVEKMPKLVASCAMPVADKMVIHTNNDRVKEARKSVMEFLLINHPLDCPICDQGGECDLQDLAMFYGFDKSRYFENKRAVKHKNLGSLIKTNMTRCIHCTRCIRFLRDVAGTAELGGINRGENLEITNFEETPIKSELSGNIIDICPVGALTSKPYAFKARPWELKETYSIDVSDGMGSNITINTRDDEVMRIIPRINDEINESWISDKARFSYDGITNNRIDKPYIRKRGKLEEATFEQALKLVAERITASEKEKIAALTNGYADCESVFILKEIFKSLGSDNLDCRLEGMEIEADKPCSYVFNSTFENIEQADLLLVVGGDIRKEASVLNSRIRKRFAESNMPVGLVGQKVDMTFDYHHLGESPLVLKDLLDGNNDFVKKLEKAKNPLMIISSQVFCREDGRFISNLLRKIAEKYYFVGKDKTFNGYSVLHDRPNMVGSLLLGFVPQIHGFDRKNIVDGIKNKEIDFLYLLNDDEVDAEKIDDAFVVYQGTHFNDITQKANVVLPSVTYAEKDAFYINSEARLQKTMRAIFPICEAKEDWEILKSLANNLKLNLGFETKKELIQKINEKTKLLEKKGKVKSFNWVGFGLESKVDEKAFQSPVKDYFSTNPIVKNSKIMQNHKKEVEGND